MVYFPDMSGVIELGNKLRSQKVGWDISTEDVVSLISGLSEIQVKGGGYLSVGSFHNLDIALDRQAQAIVLTDVDRGIVRLNRSILEIIEKTNVFEDMLPHVREFIGRQRIMEPRDFNAFIGRGTYLTGGRTRTPLNWAKKPEDFSRVKQLLHEGKVAVVCADITKPATMEVIREFFSSQGTYLQYANISNVENSKTLVPNARELKALKRIPECLYQAGGIPATIVIGAVEVRGNSPEPDVIKFLRPKERYDSSTLYYYRHYLRTLADFAKNGPTIVPHEDLQVDN